MTEEREKELHKLFRDLMRGASFYAEAMRQQHGLEISHVIRGGFEALDAAKKFRDERDQLAEALTNVNTLCSDLMERQQKHLALIANLSKSTPFENEIHDLRRHNAALIAEVGTLRARLSHP